MLDACGFGPSPMRDIWDLARILDTVVFAHPDTVLRLVWDWEDMRLVVSSKRRIE